MKTLFIFPVFAFLFSGLSGQAYRKFTDSEAFDLINTIDTTPFKRNTHPNAQWFPEAGLGLFIHWGIHSVAALDPSWTMIKNCPWAGPGYYVGREKYYQLAREFNPSDYDPEKWIIAARQAGFQYVVLTTKHHDGYCLWPSRYGNLTTADFMNSRDLLKPYVEACRKYGLKVGFYFSPRDWSNPDYPIPYPDFDYKNKGARELYPADINQQKFNAFFRTTIGQLSELLTNYGKIDLLWFDSLDWPKVDTYSEKLHTWLRILQPEMLVNPRWETNDSSKHFGDFKSEEVSWGSHPENKPANIQEGDWWEFCNSWSGNWGYSPMNRFTAIEAILKIFVYTRAFGGNYLLNIGPAPDGSMRPGFYEECHKLALWMENHKESVIGCQAVPDWQKIANVPLTRKNNVFYAHIFQEHQEPILINTKVSPVDIRLLENGGKVAFQYHKKTGLKFIVNDSLRNNSPDVVVRIEFLNNQ